MLLSILLLMSCFGAHRSQSPLDQAGKSFVTSNSPCLDSTLVNIDHAGCRSMTSTTAHGLLKISCDDRESASDHTNPWLRFDFFVVQTDSADFTEMPMPICIDPVYTVFYYPKEDL
jgi:hypothetical protein